MQGAKYYNSIVCMLFIFFCDYISFIMNRKKKWDIVKETTTTNNCDKIYNNTFQFTVKVSFGIAKTKIFI